MKPWLSLSTVFISVIILILTAHVTGQSNGKESRMVYLPIVEKPPINLPPAVIEITNLPAFDTCDPPSLTEMQTWWDHSPYYNIGIYLGGISYSKDCDNSSLTQSWIAEASRQGWYFIPIWVGPQAPCYGWHHPMSADIGVAFQQGRAEAEAAATVAANLGLTANGLSGGLIYYDLEAYGGSRASPECRAAVNTFIHGWVTRLHELGSKAGVYGAGCSSNASDWASLPQPPDYIWLASWYTNAFDPDASVWDVKCVSNNLWAEHQRLYQYTGGHYEDWGGVNINIDCNVSDGGVVAVHQPTITLTPPITPSLTLTPSPTSTPTPTTTTSIPITSTPTTNTSTQISLQKPYTLIHQGRILHTSDGNHWQDITPILPVEEIPQKVFFLNESFGWFATYPRNDTPLAIYQTSNGGETWQRISKPEGWPVLEEDVARLRSLQFINQQTAFIVLQLPSSSNFSRGLLLQSKDGGKTWQKLSIPLGEPAYFSSVSTGWVSDGPDGKQAYLTKDGGRTWQKVSLQTLPGNRNAPTLPDNTVHHDFVTAQEGWAKSTHWTCPNGKHSCHTIVTWWLTCDGGTSWQHVQLP